MIDTRALLAGDVSALDPRADLPGLLALVRAAEDPEPLFAALATRAPLALAEVVCGPRAPGGATAVRAALPHAAVLERVVPPKALYPRLLDLAGEANVAVLEVAASRHPAASWLVAMSRKAEPFAAGLTHLLAAANHPSFAAACRLHAEAGHAEGLVFAAGETGRAEPAAALLSVDPAAALRAAGAALDRDPAAAVVAHLAAVWGPDPDPLLVRLIPHLRSRAAAEALRNQSRHLPRTAAALGAVLRGMV